MNQFTTRLRDSFRTPIQLGDHVEYTYEYDYEEPCGSMGSAQDTGEGTFLWDAEAMAFYIQTPHRRKFISEVISFKKI